MKPHAKTQETSVAGENHKLYSHKLTAMNKELYDKASKAAYANSLQLLHEALVLYEHDRYARAYALAVLSCEEFAKSFIYKCIACGIELDSKIQKDLTNHELKLQHFVRLIAVAQMWHMITDDVIKTVEHNKRSKDLSKYVLPSVLDSVKGNQKIMSFLRLIVDAFKYSNMMKMNALYVDINKGKVQQPSDLISGKTCDGFLKVLEYYIRSVEDILSQDEEEFRNTIDWLRPKFVPKHKN